MFSGLMPSNIGLFARRFELLALAEIGGEGHHFAAELGLQPLEDDRGIEAAGIGEHDFLRRGHGSSPVFVPVYLAAGLCGCAAAGPARAITALRRGQRIGSIARHDRNLQTGRSSPSASCGSCSRPRRSSATTIFRPGSAPRSGSSAKTSRRCAATSCAAPPTRCARCWPTTPEQDSVRLCLRRQPRPGRGLSRRGISA